MNEPHASLIADEVALPAAVIRKPALDHNLAWMQAFADAHGLSLAPHGKTTMSPELMSLQIAAGAWGMTAAHPLHARLYAEWEIGRIIIANQVVGRRSLETLAGVLADFPAAEVHCLVDSIAGVDALAQALEGAPGAGRLKVLIEIGDSGQRAGVRSAGEALAVAAAAAAAPALRLAGVEIFEGVHAHSDASGAHLARFAEAVRAIDAAGLFESDEVIVSAGGSLFFDQAARTMLAAASTTRPLRPVLRSGCYLTHDHGMYAAGFAGIAARGLVNLPKGGLQPALEVWAHIQSRPESGQAIAALGKRHISSDAGLPVPLWHVRPGRDAAPRALEGVTTERLFDQHACLIVPPACDLAFGDLIGFGISHPCTTFDKWRRLHLVDAAYRVVGGVSTHFGIA
ncbi:alanine racemase [Erythrobacter sp. BLCC-B19]|uniref:alanine racemase n=1 Tax=Erythrobacter sp. BLCC-B19 TaxID=3025315 RepID=UPI002361BB7F|nr:alanine racemase [Erythrobacter sp. BLCC-B19]WDA41389.1 alanine racemase [Erythrobacter sp. BLCC-B19]